MPPKRRKRSCPTPLKASYRSEMQAIRHVLSLAATKNPARYYRCTCGKWHVTSWTLEQYELKTGVARAPRK